MRWQSRPVVTPAGVLVAEAPVQTPPSGSISFQHEQYQLTALAQFALEARVLSRQDYHLDRESQLAPVDLALGWGGMSDSAVLNQLDIRQSGRFYFYRWMGAPPLPPQQIIRESANMHLIPATAEIARQLREVRPGQIVQLSGQLVEARAADGWYWRSSLTREDSGAGACELVWVEALSVRTP